MLHKPTSWVLGTTRIPTREGDKHNQRGKQKQQKLEHGLRLLLIIGQVVVNTALFLSMWKCRRNYAFLLIDVSVLAQAGTLSPKPWTSLSIERYHHPEIPVTIENDSLHTALSISPHSPVRYFPFSLKNMSTIATTSDDDDDGHLFSWHFSQLAPALVLLLLPTIGTE